MDSQSIICIKKLVTKAYYLWEKITLTVVGVLLIDMTYILLLDFSHTRKGRGPLHNECLIC